MKKALLKTGYRCNNNCVFCHSAPHRPLEADGKELRRKLYRARLLGAEMVVFSGGEPTLRRDLVALARHAAGLGLKLGLVSNGRMLCYPGLIDELLSIGLDYAQITLCGPDRRLHDRHVRAPAFEQTMGALRLLQGRVRELAINVVVTRWNLRQLQRMLPLAREVAGARLKFSLVEPEGNALEYFGRLVPRLTEAASAVTRALTAGRDIRPGFDGLPLCLVPQQLWPAETTLREDGFCLVSEVFERDWYPVDEGHRAHAFVCSTCSLRRRCRGVFRMYLEKKGAAELRPLRLAVPNSYVLEPAGVTLSAAGGVCPFRSGGVAPPLAPREIFIRRRGFVEKFHYRGGDFSDQTLDFCQRELGQLYLRTGPTGDFSTAVRPLVRSPQCRRCPRWRLCGGLWRPASPAFPAFERWLGRRLASLEGKALDVGCGHAPYLKFMLPAVQAGRLFYHGIDPRRLPRERAEGLLLEKTAFADFSGRRLYDQVLLIRSLDHTGRPRETLSRIRRLTRPGSRLIIVEDIVFGMVDRAPKGPRRRARFEHLLNLGLDEALALCRKAGFRPVFWRAPSEGTVPCWYLECER